MEKRVSGGGTEKEPKTNQLMDRRRGASDLPSARFLCYT